MAIDHSGTAVPAGFGAVAPETSNATALNLDSVSVEIAGVRLLDRVDMQIQAGQVTAIVGPNGAGKSTLMKAMSGEQKASSGEIRLQNKGLKDWPAQELARHMAVLPQRSLLNFGFTAREVVELSRTPHNTGAAEDATIVVDVLKYLNADHLADRLYPSLSGGEQQRVQLARVVAQVWPSKCRDDELTVRLLLLDEPSSCFDLAHQQLLVQLVRELSLQRGLAVVVVLHDLNMAISCADRIAVLCRGQLYASGQATEVLNQTCIEDVFGVNANFVTDTKTGKIYISTSYDKNSGGCRTHPFAAVEQC